MLDGYICRACQCKVLRQVRHASVQTIRPSQRLSPNTAKPWLSPGKKSVPRKAQPELRPSQGRITKTGVSVLSEVPLHERTSQKSSIKARQSFDALRLNDTIRTAVLDGVLNDLDYAEPTAIQSLAIPEILDTQHGAVLMAAETGSGKTLAYLAPIMQRLKKTEEEGRLRVLGKPRAVILLPSIELVKQVGQTVKAMSHTVKLSSAVLLPEFSFRRQKNEVLQHVVDVLVTTPARLASLREEGLLSLAETQYLVIDEADTMLDTSFNEIVTPIIKDTKGVLVFCSATIPRSMDAFLRKSYPDCRRVVSPKLHSVPRRIAMKFIDVEKEYKGNKQAAMQQILQDLSNDGTEPGKVKKVLLFVNKRESIKELCDFLTSKQIYNIPFSRDVTDRHASMTAFLTQEEEISDDKPALQVMVTTDLASRGIDTVAVKNVIIYDIPYGTIDFLHRIGRTGRAGRRGRAYILVQKKRGHQWVKEIREAAISGRPLQ